MWNRVREIVKKEFLQTLREPRMRFLLFAPPLIQVVIFGFAVNLDVERSRIAFMDGDRTPASRELREAFEGSPNFTIAAEPATEGEVRRLLDRGEVMAVVRLLPGFSRAIERGEAAAVQVLVDGTNSNSASIVAQYASLMVRRFSRRVAADQRRAAIARGTAGAAGPSPPRIDVRRRVWFNAELRSKNFFIPGVLASVITIMTSMLTALSLVREREIGTMEQLMVTPIHPLDLILGKTLPFALVGFVQVVLLTVVALLLFRVPFRGSFVFLLLCSGLFLVNTLGLGLFVSTISRTQQQAMMTFFFFILPLLMLSGFAFPIHAMPATVQLLTYLNPLRYFIEILRGVFLKGIGLSILWPQMVLLSLLGLAVMAASLLRFRKRLD